MWIQFKDNDNFVEKKDNFGNFLGKKAIFWEKRQFLGNILTFKWQFSRGLGWEISALYFGGSQQEY